MWIVFEDQAFLQTLPAKLLKENYFLETDNMFVEKFQAVRVGFASMNEEEMEHLVLTLKSILNGRSADK